MPPVRPLVAPTKALGHAHISLSQRFPAKEPSEYPPDRQTRRPRARAGLSWENRKAARRAFAVSFGSKSPSPELVLGTHVLSQP
jgi:hypothetical protein